MDLQQTTATTPSEPAAPEVQTVQEPETPPAQETGAEESQGLSPESGQVGMDEEGVLHFSDDFFGEQAPEEPQPDPAQQAPQFYSVEDLGRTALSEVDVKRLDPAKIGEYWGMVQRVMTGDRERIAWLEAQIAQMRQQLQGQQPPQAQQPPTQGATPGQQPTQQPGAKLSQKELTQRAVDRAREMLGLPEDENLDLYEPEHQMAFAQAAQEVSAAQGQAAQAAERQAAEQAEAVRLEADIRALPDRDEFARWFDRQLTANGLNSAQVNARLSELSRQNGPGIVRTIVGNWYKQYRDEIGQQASTTPTSQTAAQQRTPQRAQRPPVLEGSAGTSPEGRKVFDLSKFGEMDADEQAQALRQMGIV